MYFWYKLLTYLFYIVSPIYLFFRKLKKKEHSKRYKEKLSLISSKRSQGFLMWFHVASVGEGLSILPLIEKFGKDEKIKQILITSITVSSADVLQKKLFNNKKVIHQFLPFDVPRLVNKFIDHWSPNLCIFVDSEIWPNLIFKIKKKKIPLLLVNGRITKKTYDRWRFITNFSKKIFEKFDLCIVANKESENYLKALGAKNIKKFGNLKFANADIELNNKLNSAIINKMENRKIWCAASTHPSEELFCAKTHIKLKKTYNDILTIIIPRHIDRIKKIEKELTKLNLKIVFYSNCNQINSETDILLVDAYGEASKFFNISKNVFLGGSLIKHGGQNPIEPTRKGCKVFHGPNVSNFNEIYEYLSSLGVANTVNSTEELSQSLVEEFNTKDSNNSKVVKKIDNYGVEILNNVIKEINIYINI